MRRLTSSSGRISKVSRSSDLSLPNEGRGLIQIADDSMAAYPTTPSGTPPSYSDSAMESEPKFTFINADPSHCATGSLKPRVTDGRANSPTKGGRGGQSRADFGGQESRWGLDGGSSGQEPDLGGDFGNFFANKRQARNLGQHQRTYSGPRRGTTQSKRGLGSMKAQLVEPETWAMF